MLRITKNNMIIDPVPCYNCITLSICKATLSYFHKPRPFVSMSILYSETTNLGDKCSLIYAYIRPHDSYDYNIYHRRLAVHYLTGYDLGGDMPYATYSMKELYQKLDMMEEYNET
jgi:hypothetical protein